MSAIASGPAGQTHLLQQPQGTVFTASLTAAGSYHVTVSLTDAASGQQVTVPARSQMHSIMVAPGPVSAERVHVQRLPDRLVAGVAYDMSIQPHDAFGNPGALGTLSSIAVHVWTCS